MSKLRVLSRFGTIPNHLLQNDSLSFKAKGLWGYIQSKPDGWNFSADRICNDTKDGRDSVQTGLKELEDAGLLIRNKYRDEQGQWAWEYLLKEYPSTENPSMDKPATNKERYTNKDISEQGSQNDIRVVKDDEEKPKKKAPQVALEVFNVFSDVIGKNPLNWRTNVTQRTCAENLYKERGLDGIRRALEFYIEHRGDKFCPKIHSPYDLDSKWSKLYEFKESKE